MNDSHRQTISDAAEDLKGTLDSLVEEVRKPEPNLRRVRHFRQTAKFESSELEEALRNAVGRGTGEPAATPTPISVAATSK